MNRVENYILFAATILGALGIAATPSIDSLLAPGGVWWKPKTRITVDKPVSLATDTTWSADEILVRAPVVTNGHSLLLIARRLKFKDGAVIRGFDAPAEPVSGEGPRYLTSASAGSTPSAKGDDGAEGKKGISGNHGMGAEGPLPKEILIFAAKTEGEVRLEGIGQAGGVGGKGGRGQDGGSGAQGSPAICRAFTSNQAAGTGGAGGTAGTGGTGGRGGRGGAPVPIQLLTATKISTGEQFPTLICRPGDGGPGGVAGDPGSPGAPGPGGLADSINFVFTWETEKGGAPGEPGKAAPNDEATRGRHRGDTGESGPSFDAERWQNALGRSTPNLYVVLESFETSRFAVTSAWYEFHWWRLYERIARTSLELMNSDDRSDPDPLAQLIPTGFNREALSVIVEKWKKNFNGPLRAELETVRRRDPRTEAKIKRILDHAEGFVTVMQKAKELGSFAKSDIDALRTSITAVSQDRKNHAQSALEECERYTRNVLQSPAFQSRREILYQYFEVPVCTAAADFGSESGVQSPIELALNFDAIANPGLEGIVIESSVPPTVPEKHSSIGRRFYEAASEIALRLLPFLPWEPEAIAAEMRHFDVRFVDLEADRLNPSQLTEFLPSRKGSSVVGSLGLHKGYAMPDAKAIDLGTLGKYLINLRQLLSGGNR